MVLRRASREDMEELVKIRLGYLSEDAGGLTKEQEDALRKVLPDYYEGHLDKDFFAYIAEDKGRVVSSVFMVVLEKPANLSFITGRIGNILNVFTYNEYRRQGLAGSLLQMAIDDAKELNLSYLELMASSDGYPLYQKYGFMDMKSTFVPMKLVLE